MKKIALMLAVAALPILAGAQTTSLKLPQNSGDMREYMAQGDPKCPGCGVVSNVRQVPRTDNTRKQPVSQPNTGGNADLGGGSTATVAGTGAASKAERKEARKPAAPGWLVTVRYDDGSYASFDLDERPTVRKGERVQVNAGKVERYVAR